MLSLRVFRSALGCLNTVVAGRQGTCDRARCCGRVPMRVPRGPLAATGACGDPGTRGQGSTDRHRCPVAVRFAPVSRKRKYLNS